MSTGGSMKISKAVLLICLLIVIFTGADYLISQTQPQAGFYSLAGNDFYFHKGSYFNRIALRSSQARIWYVFQPAEKDPAGKPLFLFFNGGPGGGTSSGLMSAFTGKNAVTVDKATGAAAVTGNPWSWTKLGNLLYIDARTTGFSYSLMDNPGDENLRKAEFDAQNYNSFIDGADFVRVLLRFLADHPDLQRNPVVLVSESYGGTRSTVMLNLLLYYQDFGNGTAVFQDPGLEEEIQQHYNTVFPAYSGQTVPPHIITGQFGHQIMVQPSISREYQKMVAAEMLETPGSIIYQLAAETGVPFVRWQDQPGSSGTPTTSQIINNIYAYLEKIDRDPYIVSHKDGFLLGYFGAAADLLTRYEDLNKMSGFDVAEIAEMYAAARSNAYKIRFRSDGTIERMINLDADPLMQKMAQASSLNAAGEDRLADIFGVLQPWDGYFVDLNYDVNNAFYYNRPLFLGYGLYYASTPLYGRMFLENVAVVDTFITNAAYDVVVFCPALPRALGKHTSMLFSSEHDKTRPQGADRPGRILLDYIPGSVPGVEVSSRTIRFPFYADSGHAVTLTEPAEILADVTAWLDSTGLVQAPRKGEKR